MDFYLMNALLTLVFVLYREKQYLRASL